MDLEKADLTPHDICSLLGLCYSQFGVKFNRVNAEPMGSEYAKNGVISGRNAAAALQAKVYRKFGNGRGMNPSIWSNIPIFKSHSKTELFRSGKFSKYSCQFRIVVTGKLQMVYNIIVQTCMFVLILFLFFYLLTTFVIYYYNIIIVILAHQD